MDVNQFKEEVKKIYAKYFDGSLITIEHTHGIFRNIIISCYLAKDTTEVYNGIAMNDMFRQITFSLTNGGNEFERSEYWKKGEMILPENLVLEKWNAYYLIKPQSKYLVYSSKGVAFRKSTGNAEAILKVLDKFFNRLNNQLHSDLETGLIHDNHIDLLKKRLK